jgi:hypothetical protein
VLLEPVGTANTDTDTAVGDLIHLRCLPGHLPGQVGSLPNIHLICQPSLRSSRAEPLDAAGPDERRV